MFTFVLPACRHPAFLQLRFLIPLLTVRLCYLASLRSGKICRHMQAVCPCLPTTHAHLPLSKDTITNPAELRKSHRALLLRSRISFTAPDRTVSAIIRGLGRLVGYSIPALPRMTGAGWICPSPWDLKCCLSFGLLSHCVLQVMFRVVC